MSGRKRTAKGKIRKYSTKTDNSNSSDSDSNEEPVPGSSKQIISHATPSRIDSNNELLKQNPFLIPNVLACLCGHSSRQALLKYRLVGQHMWNELAVNAINQDKSVNVSLVKLLDLDRIKNENISTGLGTAKETGVIINIEELISTLRAGKLEKSTLTRIYLHSSLTNFHIKKLLKLTGLNISTLHYDGNSLKDLRKILQTCANNLINLSLWSYWKENKDERKGLFKNQIDTFKLPCLVTLAIASGELSPHLSGISDDDNLCNPSREFLTDIFQASPNLKSLSARFFDSFILESGLSFKNLTTLCIKFKIRIPQLRALCHVGLRLIKLRLQGLFIASHEGEDNYRYMDDPDWMEFRLVLLNFIQTQANTLEYFAVCLFEEKHSYRPTEHNTPHEQWSSRSGFPRMPNLNTFILYECSGKIPKEEFGYLFPKLRNLEIVGCEHSQVVGPPQPNIMDYPLQIPISANPAICVRSIRGIKPTMELAQIFPGVIELHIENTIPHELPNYWPKLKHLYYKDESDKDRASQAVAKIRQINKFLVGISPRESKRIEKQTQNYSTIIVLKHLELPRSRASIFALHELETFDFEFISYEYDSSDVESALQVLITLGLSRLTHLKKLNFALEQKLRPTCYFALPTSSLGELENTFMGRKYLNISTNCDWTGRVEDDVKPTTKEWALELNLDHHKSEWKEVDGLFREDPDICELGLSIWVDEDMDSYDDD